jgi:excisionase family DNA binding protein
MNTSPTEGRQCNNPDPLLTLADAAEYLGVSIKTTRRLIAAGVLQATYVGSLVRVRTSHLEAYLGARTGIPQSLAASS